MPFGNLSTATDALIRDHFDGQFNNLDTGLLNDKQELCFVFWSQSVFFGPLLYPNDLRNHVRIVFGVVAFVSYKTAFNQIIELASIQKLN